jgi:hypothetical protein
MNSIPPCHCNPSPILDCLMLASRVCLRRREGRGEWHKATSKPSVQGHDQQPNKSSIGKGSAAGKGLDGQDLVEVSPCRPDIVVESRRISLEGLYEVEHLRDVLGAGIWELGLRDRLVLDE